MTTAFNTLVSALVGRTINAVERVHDYYQITFSDGAQLSIYTPFRVEGGSPETPRFGIGQTIVSAAQVQDDFVVTTSTDMRIAFSLRECDLNGPEGLYFSAVDQSPIVWP
jgi:hypothetical protein